MPARPQEPRGRRPPRARGTRGFVAVGRILAPWGIRGQVKVEPLTDFPERFRPGGELWINGRPVRVSSSRWHSGFVYLGIEGTTNRNDAEPLRNRLLEVPESDLQPLGEGRYYRFQIIGLEVFTTAGRPLGRVEEILPTGADDVFVVRGPDGELLLPAIEDVVRDVDVAAGRMTVEPLEEG